MIESVPAVLESLLKAKSLAGLWANWRRKSSGNAALLVEELRDNLRFCTLVLEDGADIGAVLDVLSTSQYDRLLGEDPEFKSLGPNKIRRFQSLEKSDLASWQGKPTGDLVKNVYGKIKDVQVLYPRTPGGKQRRWHVRVANIRKKILLLLRNSKT